MRTVDEIKQAYRERATSEYAKVRTSMTGEDLATIFDYIATLEAKVTALGEWELIAPPPIGEGNESVSNLVLTLKAYFPPPNTFDGEPYFVPQCDIYHHRSTAGFTGWQSEYGGEGGLYSKTIGWIEILDPPFSKQELLSMKELIDKQRTPAES